MCCVVPSCGKAVALTSILCSYFKELDVAEQRTDTNKIEKKCAPAPVHMSEQCDIVYLYVLFIESLY